uniref:RING-type domain-containing protein n=1 Tax=viral metagenome TaxID=1070528 RepID=A0A6C0KZ39_9ZZZZ
MKRCKICFEKLTIFHTKDTSFSLEKPEYNRLLSDDECGICLDLLKGSPCIKTEHCNHVFHRYCYKKYLEQTKIKKELGCPFCSSNQDNLNNFVIENK